MEVKEIQIPVPWGHVAARTWGTEEQPPVLAAHGIQDNAGTFDRLIPYLPRTFRYICVDLPSHGRSSHLPPHLPIQAEHYVMVFKIILDYLNRKKYILVGHSFGGNISVLFTQLYPEYVEKLIMLDCASFPPISTESYLSVFKDDIENLIQLNEKLNKNSPPEYTYEEALGRIIDYRKWGLLNEEAGKPLLKRALVSIGNGKFRFSTDPRLKYLLSPAFSIETYIELYNRHPIMCPVLIILATNSTPYFEKIKSVLDELKKSSVCTIKNVEGSHDVHNTNPELVGPLISGFLIKQKSKL